MGTKKKIAQIVSICCWLLTFTAAQITEDQMKTILEDYNREASLLCNRNSKANWDVQTDVLNEGKAAIQSRALIKAGIQLYFSCLKYESLKV